MSDVTVRSVTTATTVGQPSLTTPSANVGDRLCIIHANDYYTTSTMNAPVVNGTDTPSLIVTADSGANGAHIKAYLYAVTSAGTQTVAEAEGGSHDEDKELIVYVLANVDPAAPTYDAQASVGTASLTQPAPGLTLPGNGLMIVHVNSGGGAATSSYGFPGGMTPAYELHPGGMSAAGAYEQIAVAQSTGSRTFTAANPVPWAAVSIAFHPAPPPAPPAGGPLPANASVRLTVPAATSRLSVPSASAQLVRPSITVRIPV